MVVIDIDPVTFPGFLEQEQNTYGTPCVWFDTAEHRDDYMRAWQAEWQRREGNEPV